MGSRVRKNKKMKIQGNTARDALEVVGSCLTQGKAGQHCPKCILGSTSASLRWGAAKGFPVDWMWGPLPLSDSHNGNVLHKG